MIDTDIANIIITTTAAITINTYQYTKICEKYKKMKELDMPEESLKNQKKEIVKNLVAILKYYKNKVDTEIAIQGKANIRYIIKCKDELNFIEKITNTVDENLYSDILLEVFK